ncbi:LOW QUALITY PROTEIN: hypothetical protein BU14_1672s0003, partial [Porphyra umbilicalis]
MLPTAAVIAIDGGLPLGTPSGPRRAPPATVPGSLLQQERLGKARDARALLSPHGRARQAPHNDLRRCGGRLELRATGAAKACPSRGQPRARTSNRSGPMHGGSGKQCRQRVPAVARRIALGARGRCCHTDATAGQRRHGAAAWQPRPRVPPRVTPMRCRPRIVSADVLPAAPSGSTPPPTVPALLHRAAAVASTRPPPAHRRGAGAAGAPSRQRPCRFPPITSPLTGSCLACLATAAPSRRPWAVVSAPPSLSQAPSSAGPRPPPLFPFFRPLSFCRPATLVHCIHHGPPPDRRPAATVGDARPRRPPGLHQVGRVAGRLFLRHPPRRAPRRRRRLHLPLGPRRRPAGCGCAPRRGARRRVVDGDRVAGGGRARPHLPRRPRGRRGRRPPTAGRRPRVVVAARDGRGGRVGPAPRADIGRLGGAEAGGWGGADGGAGVPGAAAYPPAAAAGSRVAAAKAALEAAEAEGAAAAAADAALRADAQKKGVSFKAPVAAVVAKSQGAPVVELSPSRPSD